MFLDDTIRSVQAAVEQKFLFRKIGLPFDYASDPDDFPSKCFATAKEARGNLPNPAGLGGGYHFSCRNHALLFDGYLLRMELGIESPGDEAILDRLIGGLIRLATVAPKAFLIGGLSPDGRGFYARPERVNHAAWAFAVVRGLASAAIAPESQEKFRSIAGKWIERLRRENFRLHTVDGKPAAAADISRPDAECGAYALACMLTAALATRADKDFEQYRLMAEEQDRARLGTFIPAAGATDDLLWRQLALSVIAENDPEPERAALARTRLRENANAAAPRIPGWREWDAVAAADTPVNLDWRARPKAPVGENPYGFVPDASWERIFAESRVEDSLCAAYSVLLCGDSELAQTHAEEIAACLTGVDWGRIASLCGMAGAIAVHARGVELDLWDKDLFSTRRQTPASEMSIVAKYLEPGYDEENPSRAGHAGAPPGKPGADARPADVGGRRRRRRRRK